MSDEEDISATFNCYYGGQFNKADRQIYYVGGSVRIFEAKPSDIFSELMNQLPVSLYGQSVWYKLPFEEQDDRKPICNGDANFKKMCSAAAWTKAIDIFVEPDINEAETEEADEDARYHCGQFEKEARVEQIVADFVDVDDEYDEYATPRRSDSEDDDNFKEGYVRYIKGSGELKLRQVFDSLEGFKSAIVDYVLKSGRNVKYVRWEKDKSELKCASQCEKGKEIEGGKETERETETEGKKETKGDGEPCAWRIYCSYEAPLQKWMVKVYNDDHSCMKTGYSRILTQEVIARLFVNDVRDNPKLMHKSIQEDIQNRWNLIATNDQVRKAKKRALEIIQEEHDEQYSRMKDYRLELLDSNADSTVELETYAGSDGQDVFHRFYVCFANIRRAWCKYCRPIFGLDGCFLKGTSKGQLLAAVGRDANNQMYPIAWAVVDKENEDNWVWFIEKLQSDFNLRDGDGFTVISDRQKGLLNGVSQLLPKAEHRMCARHIYANLKKCHPHRADMKGLFWKVAKSYNKAQYEKSLEKLKGYDMSVYDSVMQKNPKNCSLTFFKPTASCDDVSNNISESFNHAIDPARVMPLVEMLETIRRRAMVRIDLRRKKAMRHKGKYSLKAMERVELEHKKTINCKAIPAGVDVYEVKEKKSSFRVYMEMHSCTCRRWDMSGIPCRHALKVISDKKLNREDYISSSYLTSIWRDQYNAFIEAVRGMNFWRKSGETEILPPPTDVTQGRKPIHKRIKERNESPQKKKKTKEINTNEIKVTREKRIIHCGNCGEAGHNTRRCQNVGFIPPKKSKRKTTEDGCEGPTQSQVID